MVIKRNHKGMSLVEIMGAIFVLSFAVLAVATIFPAGLQMNRKTKVRIQAIQMAAGIIEELRHLPYYDPNTTCLLDLATINPDMNATVTDGWGGFDDAYCENGSNEKWTPNVVKNSNVHDGISRVFFRSRSKKDMRKLSTPDTLVDTLSPKLMYPAIRIAPLGNSTTNPELMYSYTPAVNRCRIHKIIVTANIEEFVAGTARYSTIQLITYRSDGLTMTPGY